MPKLSCNSLWLTLGLALIFLFGNCCEQVDPIQQKNTSNAHKIEQVACLNHKTEKREIEAKKTEGCASRLLALSLHKEGRKEEAFNHLRSAIEIFAKINNVEFESDCLISYALWLKQEARYPEALDSINRAIELLETADLENSLANAYKIAGQCYYSTGIIDKCLDCYHSALDIYENIGLDTHADEVTVDIIGASVFLDEQQKSIDYAYQFLNDGRPKTDLILAQVYTNIALAYFIDQPEEAIKVARKALTFTDDDKTLSIRVDALSLLSHSLIALKKDSEAKEYLEQARTIIEKHDLKEKKQQAYNDLARYYYKQGELQKALECVNEALPVAKSSENFIGQFVSYSLLHDIYEKKEDFKKADKYSQIIIEISHDRCKDKLIKEQKSQSIKYDLKAKDQKIELLKREKSIRELRLSRQALVTKFITSAMLLISGLALAIFIAYRNNTKALKREARLSRQDPLTKLLNRRAMYELLEVEIERFERSYKPFSLLIADIDNFKKFNDRYGHDCGDVTLLMISETLKNTIRKQDKVARWGGEEFLIILPETDADGATNLAEKLRQKIENSVLEHKSGKLSITMSFGVSQHLPDTGINITIKAADQALYLSKKRGRNRVSCA